MAAPVMMEKANEKFWLMKVPNFLIDHLRSASEANAEIGHLIQDQETNEQAGSSSNVGSVYTLKLKERPEWPENEVREFSVTLGPPTGAMYVLSEPDGSTAWRHEGRVQLKGEIRPKTLSNEYKSIVHTRVENATNKREIEEWEEDMSIRQVRRCR